MGDCCGCLRLPFRGVFPVADDVIAVLPWYVPECCWPGSLAGDTPISFAFELSSSEDMWTGSTSPATKFTGLCELRCDPVLLAPAPPPPTLLFMEPRYGFGKTRLDFELLSICSRFIVAFNCFAGCLPALFALAISIYC